MALLDMMMGRMDPQKLGELRSRMPQGGDGGFLGKIARMMGGRIQGSQMPAQPMMTNAAAEGVQMPNARMKMGSLASMAAGAAPNLAQLAAGTAQKPGRPTMGQDVAEARRKFMMMQRSGG